MLLDAIVLAGGRSSRLAGVPKAELVWRGQTLLQTAVNTAADAGSRHVVVVGPAGGSSVTALRAEVSAAREDPPFGGPAAAIGAGMAALETFSAASAEAVLVLACDMPRAARGVATLVTETLARVDRGDGVIMVDLEGRRQPLAAVYRRTSLADAVARLRASGGLDGGSMRSLIGSMSLAELIDRGGYTRDVDTWSDAERFGISTVRSADGSTDFSPGERATQQ